MTSHTAGAAVDSGRGDQPMPRPPLTKRLRPGDWLAIDCVTAVLLAVVFLVGSTRPAYGIPVSVAYLLALASTTPRTGSGQSLRTATGSVLTRANV